MRAFVVAVILVSLTGTAAAGGGVALELTGGLLMPSGSLSRDAHDELGIVGIGAQLGRVAVLYRVEISTMTPAREDLDSGDLKLRGRGVAFRAELVRKRNVYVHATVGFMHRTLDGDGLVPRGCTLFGGCDAGYYREVPAYTDDAPFMSIAAGVKTDSRWWPGIGIEVGAGPMTIDRSGDAPDAQGAIVWLGLNATLGAN